MNKRDNIVQIKYRIGDWIRDRHGEIARIVKVNGINSSISYIGTKYEDAVSMWYILENYVPCVFQVGDLVRLKSDTVKITGLMRSDKDDKYYYVVQCKGVSYFELVKDVDTHGKYTKN